jgi:hypothetical protein
MGSNGEVATAGAEVLGQQHKGPATSGARLEQSNQYDVRSQLVSDQHRQD